MPIVNQLPCVGLCGKNFYVQDILDLKVMMINTKMGRKPVCSSCLVKIVQERNKRVAQLKKEKK